MTQLNFTMEMDDLVYLVLQPQNERIAKIATDILNQALEAQCEAQIQAKRYERTEERVEYRNGYYSRSLNTLLGKLVLRVPRLRNGPLETQIFENYSRSETGLLTGLMEMVIQGVSTRKVTKITEELCGCSFSKSTISKICQKLDPEVETFRHRPLESSFPFVFVDAMYIRVREDGHIVKKALTIALAIRNDGYREIVGFGLFDGETDSSWRKFINSLKERGLENVDLFISDSHASIKKAITETYPQAQWQHCQAHLVRNILDEVARKDRKTVSNELSRMFGCTNFSEARKIRDEIVDKYYRIYPKAMNILDDNFIDATRIMGLKNSKLQYSLRTSNRIERLNRELRRREKVIQVFPNAKSAIRILGAVLMEQNEELSCSARITAITTYRENRTVWLQNMKEIA
jgi:Transposase and inactivated derivatives